MSQPITIREIVQRHCHVYIKRQEEITVIMCAKYVTTNDNFIRPLLHVVLVAPPILINLGAPS